MVSPPRLSVRALLVGALLVVLAACGSSGGSKSSKAATRSPAVDSSTSPPPAALASAKGKPCVALADPLPSGAPEVPIKVGPAPTALVVEDLTPGTGPAATSASTVTVDYIGVACSTGRIFDSSYSRGQPTSFPLSGVIQGWSQGLVGMKVGGKRLLGIPAELAYGATPPDGSGIAPDEPLWFVVEMRGVQ
jgi:peptidylprolyl isomerase